MVDEVGPVDDRTLAEEMAVTLAQARSALPPAGPDVITMIKERYQRGRRRRARLASAAVAVLVLAVTLAGTQLVRGGGPASVPAIDSEATETIRVWAIAQSAKDSALRQLVDRYNRGSRVRVELTTFGNAEYKEKLLTLVGSPDGPDVFASWGGAHLTKLAREGRLTDLTSLRRQPGVADKYLPSTLAGGVVDGRQYGLPMSGTYPIVLFYHKGVFAEAGLSPPRGYADLLRLVDRFKADGIVPIALGGADGWTELMYVMYLAERIGGPGTTTDITLGRPGVWSKPAVLEALRLAQGLAERGAFGTDFSMLGYDNGGASERLASGAAAMQLMGAWEYASQLSRNPEFILNGDLGWVPFPAVAGGVGDPADLVGVPANYFSVSAGSRHREAAVEFVRSVTTDDYLDDLAAAGEVPPVTDAVERLRGTEHAKFATSVSELVARAGSYNLAWDQALDPETATALNANLRRLFRSELTPEQFAAAMTRGG